MPYPEFINRFGNHTSDKNSGRDFDTARLDRDLNALIVATNALNTRLRAITAADGDLKPANPDRENDIVTVQTLSGTGIAVTFSLVNPIDLTTTMIGNVYVAGVLQFVGTDYTYDATSVTFVVPPPAAANNITYNTYMNVAGQIDRLESILFQQGAYQVGYPDQNSLYAATTAGGALDEVRQLFDDFVTALGDLSNILLRDGSRTLTDNWEVNDRGAGSTAAPAAGDITIVGTLVDGSTVTIFDGIIPGGKTFEFDSNATVTLGNILVDIDASDDVTAQNLEAAIEASGLAINATFAGAATARVDLVHDIASVIGNLLIASKDSVGTPPNPALAITGMGGGANGVFASLASRHRVRNHPPSVREGDVVVHEQMQSIYAQVALLAEMFLRLDGSTTMNGPLDFGGNAGLNVLAGTAPTDAINLGQLTAAVATLNASISGYLHQTGTKASVAEGTVTGPITLGQLATTSADEDQTTDPDTVLVATIHGVPAPSADDQVANKKYVDTNNTASKMYGTGVLGNKTGTNKNPTFPTCSIYDFESLELDVNTALPWACIIRVRGDLILNGGTHTLAFRPLVIPQSDQDFIDALGVVPFRCLDGQNGGPPVSGGAGGGGIGSNGGALSPSIGSGGHADNSTKLGGAARKASGASWVGLVPVFGGTGGVLDGANRRAGGFLILVVGGNIRGTGCILDAPGESCPLTKGDGGGAGGTVFIHCNGYVEDLTIQTPGGVGNNGANGGGGGGAAGFIVFRARSVAAGKTVTFVATGGTATTGNAPNGGAGSHCYEVTQTKPGSTVWTQTGGSVGGAGVPGANGLHSDITLTESQFNQLTVPWLE